MYQAKIVADSIAESGCRLTTFEVTYPLIIHAEIMTHRVFSRNVASNRAIPVAKLLAAVTDNPFIPERFPVNKAGMQNDEWLEESCETEARNVWLDARDNAKASAENLMVLGVHKQIANRLLAPFLWTTAVITSTDWNNFWSLRCHEAAQPEIQKIAYMMRDLYKESVPSKVRQGEWHLPYITNKDIVWAQSKTCLGEDSYKFLQMISMGRCARVSYLRQGTDTEPAKDIELCERLIESRHMSPTEHVATPLPTTAYCGNFRGWKSYRKFIEGESGE